MLNPHVPTGSPAYRIRIPDPTYVPPFVVGILNLFGLILLNATPVKRLHGFVQFLISAVAGAVLGRHEWALDGVVVSAIKAAIYGFLDFGDWLLGSEFTSQQRRSSSMLMRLMRRRSKPSSRTPR